MAHQILFIILLLVVGIFCLFVVKIILDIKNGNRSLSWPAVEGIIEQMRSVDDFFGNSDKKFQMKYSFNLDGKIYSSQRIKYGVYNLTTIDPGNLKKYLAKYPIGRKATVYYDPDDPKRCVLEQGADKGLYLYLGGCLLMLTFALFRIVSGNY